MSNTIVSLLLCAILKALKPEIESSSPFLTVIFASIIVDCARLISWVYRRD